MQSKKYALTNSTSVFSRDAGLDAGFPCLQKMTNGLHRGEMWLLAGWPSAGKTALAMQIAANVAASGKSVAVFGLEMARESLLDRILCNRARVDNMKYRMGAVDGEERARVERALHEIRKMPLFIDDGPGVTLATMREKLLALRSRRGLDLVIVDYLQLMGSEPLEDGSDATSDQEVSTLSRGLKRMARDLCVPFLVLSQSSCATETHQRDHKPQLSDLPESIEQAADVVAFIHREERYEPDREEVKGLADLLIAKQKHGPIGRVPLMFRANYTRFESRPEGGE